MKTRLGAFWSHCHATLRRWLRFTWISRLPLGGLLPWRAARSRRAGEPLRSFQPSLEALENRWTPDDILSAASAPLAVGGLVLLAGNHTTPMRLLLNPAPPASTVEPPSRPDTSIAPYRYTDADDPLFTEGRFNVLASVATLGGRPQNDGLAIPLASARDVVGSTEPAGATTTEADAGGLVDPLRASVQAAKSLATNSRPPSPAAAVSPAKYAGAGGGRGAGGSSTPNAGKGGGGPTGSGGANLHLPGVTSLQQFLPGNNGVMATSHTDMAPTAPGSATIASNALSMPAATPDNQAARVALLHQRDSATAPSPTAPLPPPASPKTSSPPAAGGTPSSHSTSHAAALQPSTLALRSSAASAVAGQMVTFTATISSPTKSPPPTGKVVFSDGGQTLGNAPLRNGTAAFSTSGLPVGSYKLRAAYAGDNHFLPSANTQSQTVHPDGTAVALQARPAPKAPGLAVTFTASVYPMSPGSGSPTGTVDFRGGSVELGKASLREGVATLTALGSAVGGSGVTAVYEGDSQFRGSQGSLAPTNPPSGTSTGSVANAARSFGTMSNSGSASHSIALGNPIQASVAASGTSKGSRNGGVQSALVATNPPSGGSPSGSGPATWKAQPSYTEATVSPITAIEGQAFSGTVLKSLADPDPSTVYFEQVNWGDGTSSKVYTIGSASSPLPVLTHTYTVAGSYQVLDSLSSRRSALTGWTSLSNGANGSTALYTDAVILPTSLKLVAHSPTVTWPHALTNVTVATFVVPGGKASNYTATIDWGDGSGPLQATIVSEGNGTFAVQGSHTYLHPGTFLTDIRVTDIHGVIREVLGSVKVIPPYLPPDLVPTALDVMMNQKNLGSVEVATFTIGDVSLTTAEIAATIDWGDGTMPSLGVLQGSNGSFTVTGSHSYQHPGQYLLTVNVVSPLDTALAWATAHVGTPDVALSPQSFSSLAPNSVPTQPAEGNILLATFADPSPSLTVADFRATIDWGNGAGPLPATITGTAGTFWVSAAPPYPGYQGAASSNYTTYQEVLRYVAKLTVSDTANDILATGNSSVNFANAGAVDEVNQYRTLAWAKPAWFHVTSPASITSFPSTTGNLLYQIEWGDDSAPSVGPYDYNLVEAFPWYYLGNPPGTFTHAYTTEGTFTQDIHFLFITYSGTSSPALASLRPFAVSPPPPPPPPPATTYTLASATQSVLIGDGALFSESGSVATLTATAGVALSNAIVGEIGDYEPDAAPGTYGATIDWGDGTTSGGSFVQSLPYDQKLGALFYVEGNHTYQKAGQYRVSVLTTDKDGYQIVTTSAAKVGPSPPPPPSISLTSTVRSDDPDRAFLVPSGEATLDLNMAAVRINQPLDFDASPGTTIGGSPSLVYNSATVSKPVLQVTFTTSIAPSSVKFTLTWEGTTLAPVTWTPPRSQTSPTYTGPTYVATVTLALAVAASGHYDYNLKAQATIGNKVYDGTVSGQADVVVNTYSPYGAGWNLQNTTRLVSDTRGDLLRIDGAGDERLFTLGSNGTYTTPAEDFGTITGGLALNYYLYTAKDQTKYYYDLNGRLYQVLEPNNWTTNLSYTAGLLGGITTPDHALTSFVYTAGLLGSIDEPGSRTIKLGDTGSNVTGIISAAGYTRALSYDGVHHLTVDQWSPYDSTFGYSANELLDSLSQNPISDTIKAANSALWLNASGQALALSITPPLSPGSLPYTTDYLLDTRGRELWQMQPHATLTTAPTAVWKRDDTGDVYQYIDYDTLTTSYEYDSKGDLLQVNYANGTSDSYQYDSLFHNVTQHIDPDGHISVFQYDNLSELISETIGYGTPQAATTRYAYLGGLVTSMIDADGNTTGYYYDAMLGFLLLNETLYNSSGIAVSSQTYTYDGDGNPATMVDSDKGISQYTYDDDDNLLLTIDPDGYTTSQQYDAAGLEMSSTDGRGIEADYSYDYAGLETSDDVAAKPNPAFSEDTLDAYNAAGEETQTTDPAGNVTSYSYSPAGYQTLMVQGQGSTDPATTSSAYDPDGNLTQTIDADGNTTSYAYDAVANQTLAIIGLGTLQAATTSTAYDADGNVTQSIEGYGSNVATTTDYAFDADGNQNSETTGAGSSNPDSISSSYDGDGNLTLQTDSGNPSTSSFAYDALGDQTLAIRGLGTPQAATTKEQFDGNGNQTLSIDARGNSTTYFYDADGNDTLEIQAYNTPAASTSAMAYDGDGNETLAVAGYNSSAASTTAFAFDPDGNQTLQIIGANSPSAASTSSSYNLDNQLIQQVDADLHTSAFQYDALGDQTLAVLGAGTTQAASTTDSYDGDSNLTLQVDADKNSTSYQYDPDGNQTLMIQGLGTSAQITTSSAYDADGQATLVVDALGTSAQTTTSYAFDAHGNQTLQIVGDGTSVAASTQASYDGDSDLTQQVDGDLHTSTYQFDPLGNQTLTVQGAGTTEAASSTNTYDGDGNLTQSINADGDTTNYYYDADNNETEMIVGVGTSAASITSSFYNADGEETQMIAGYGTSAATTTSYVYDADGNQTQEITGLGSGNPDTITSKYDGDGNVTQQIDSGNPSTSDYSFDALGNQTEALLGAGTLQAASNTTLYDGDGNLTLSINADGDSTSYQFDADGRETLMIQGYGTSAAENTSYLYNADSEQTQRIQAAGTSAATTTSYAYDAAGNQTQQVIGAGSNVAATTTSSYDGDGNLTQQVDPDLHTSDFYFDPLGNQTESIQGAGTSQTAITKDYYDGAGNRTQQIDADGNTTSYFYDADSQETEMIVGYGTSAASTTSMAYDADGNETQQIQGYGTSAATTTSYAYDAHGDQTLQIIGSGTAQAATTTSKYDGDGDLTQQVDGAGHTSDYYFDALGAQTESLSGAGTLQAASSSTFYDGDGNLTLSVNADGYSTSYQFDPDGNQTQMIVADGSSAPSTTSYLYNVLNEQTELIDGAGTSAANTTSYSYDADGNQTLAVTGLGSSKQESTTSSYDGDGNLTQQIDPDLHTSAYSFDALGNQTQTVTGVGSGNPDTSKEFYDGDGNLTLAVDGDGYSTSYQFDADGNETLMTVGLGGQKPINYSYLYNADGEETQAITGSGGSSPDTTSYSYDADGNQVQQITGFGSSHPETTTSKYDGDGNLTQQVDGDGNTSTFAYDALGDQTQSVLGANSSNPNTTTDSYDGDDNLTLSVNAVNDSTSYQYDPDGNQTLMISGFGTSSAATVHFGYDADGRQTQEVDPVGNTTSYQYDADGNQTQMVQAYGSSSPGTTSYQYDGDNNLTSQSNPNGTSLSLSYDANGNLTNDTWYANGTATNTLKYTYDGDGNILIASNNAGAYTFSYNALGDETQAITPSGVTLNYQYDGDENLTLITDSKGDSVTSQYDANGNLLQRDATGPGGAEANVTLGYDGDGNITNVTRQGQVSGVLQTVGSSSYAYDAQGDVTDIVHSAGSTTLASFSYSYDAAAELKQEVDNGTTTNYLYDATGQLTSAGTTGYSYDANGNPKNTGDSVGPNNELTSDGTWDYSYDANGNVTGKTGISNGLTWTYSYDTGNELTGATETNSLHQTLVQDSFSYDVFGHLLQQSIATNGGAAVVTNFVYNGDTLWSAINSAGNVQDLYVSGDQPDQYFVQVDASTGDGWYLNDHLGSVRDLMNNSGQVTDALGYSAYGQIVSQSNPSQEPLIGYAGGIDETTTGLGLFSHRWFNPQTQQWMSQDDILLQAGPNTREYVNDAPTDGTDPTGQFLIAANHVAAYKTVTTLRDYWQANATVEPLKDGRYYVHVPLKDWDRLRAVKTDNAWDGAVLRAASSATANLELYNDGSNPFPSILWTKDTELRFPEEMRGHAEGKKLSFADLSSIASVIQGEASKRGTPNAQEEAVLAAISRQSMTLRIW